MALPAAPKAGLLPVRSAGEAWIEAIKEAIIATFTSGGRVIVVVVLCCGSWRDGVVIDDHREDDENEKSVERRKEVTSLTYDGHAIIEYIM
jgi:hypothetical protein